MSATTVLGVLYAFTVVLYCLCARFSYSRFRNQDRKQQTVLTFLLATVIMICGSMHFALKNQYARLLFVDYSSSPGGPISVSSQSHASTMTVLRMLDAVILLAEILTVGVLLWRVCVVYSGTRFAIPVITIASLLYLGYVVSDTLQLAFVLSNISRLRDFGVVPAIVAALGISAASHIVMTSMIIVRLMLIRRKHIKLMGSNSGAMVGKTDMAAQYLSIATMLIESYALSTAWNISFLIAHILKNGPAHNFFNNTVAQVEVLSYFLVLYRVYSGRAWDRQTQNQLSTMRWNHHTSTQASEDESGMGAVRANINVEPNASVFLVRPTV
ncbi:hypothetical protein AGABI1DRAFT_109358 [Agaricus bisporus var. burnettii JB137-S8]|uniref:Uncharacterized protein n=1 Tax=Agaricus bisporus var. burnettii (strain JB137-S8 / ATCC MYA-4627 / FGSC 10392) TaxID=597362 RepID=K5XM46_AGABU|nr:uncharacterized protein AGABI1DRAFT_109358 [Agaricus bisporus var. burnettii JB137-S8]EKM75605.1 hypothetical protein AGABI1DRAFT_109358 [Agaricus bisporus var. burnettii JB137-S8]